LYQNEIQEVLAEAMRDENERADDHRDEAADAKMPYGRGNRQ